MVYISGTSFDNKIRSKITTRNFTLHLSLQDVEDFFIVVDLLLGGDLGYHLSKNIQFTITDMKLYLLEMASVLDYLRSKSIIHRFETF